METVLEKERRLLAHLSQAMELAEIGQLPKREVEARRCALRDFYAEVLR